MSKINLVNNGIFPITKDKDGNSLSEKLDTEYSVAGTFQGEGALIGVPVLFIRTSGCNLRCVFRDNKGGATPCDTAYSSHYAETNLTEIEDIVSVVNQNRGNINHIVISGGEPTLQKEVLAELLQRLQQEGFHTTIETNATIYTDDIAKYTNLISMSPKLKTSNPTKEAVELAHKIDPKLKYNEKWEKKHDEIRRDIPAIQKYIDSCFNGDSTSTYFEINYNKRKVHKSFQLKFVVSKVEDLDEIENDFIKHLKGVRPTDIYLMPEGITPQELMERGGWVAEEAIKRGWVFAPRLHCLMFGHAKRGV